MFFRSILLGSLIALSGLTPSAQAKTETCIPIPLVGGEGNQVIKKVSPPTIPAGPLGMLGVNITNNN